MPLEYALYDNPLTPDPNDFAAKVQNPQNYTLAQVISQMTQEGSILKTTECDVVLKAFFKQLAKNIDQGIGLHCSYISLALTIRGVFTSENDRFDPERHEKVINIVGGKVLKEALNQMEVKKVKPSLPTQPILGNFLDIMSNTVAQLTKGGLGELKGEQLKINEAEADEGIFIINIADNSETKVERLHQNFPGNLQFIIPATLTAATYALEVRNRAHKGKELRKGRLDTTVTVA